MDKEALRRCEAELLKAHEAVRDEYAKYNQYISEVDQRLQMIDTALESVRAHLSMVPQ